MRILKKRFFAIGFLLLLFSCTSAALSQEDEEVLFAPAQPLPQITVTSPTGIESYAVGGTLRVAAQGRNTGSIQVTLTSPSGVVLSQSQQGDAFDYTFQLPERFSEPLTVAVVGYSEADGAGQAAQTLLQVLSPKEEFIERMIALAKMNSTQSRFTFARAESDTDIGVYKNFVMRLFDTYKADYRMAAFPELAMFMPKNNTKANCAPYDYGIEWAPAEASDGCPFEIVAQFKYDNDLTKEENAQIAYAMLEQVQRGDFFQMVGNYGGGNGPHSLFFIKDYNPSTTMLHWTDSNMRGKRIDGVRWGYLQYDADATAEWFVNCINTKKRGATLYRLRDDLYKYE
ncbi:MAG: hypothetical protein IJ461_09390 [Clostridia bacterium]|nr:hypothetical protein [Clostridia bacterium]